MTAKSVRKLGKVYMDLSKPEFPLTVIVASSTLSTGVGPYGLTVYGPFEVWDEAVKWARTNLNHPGTVLVEWQAVRIQVPFEVGEGVRP